jgi:hypothetical protein
MVIGYVLLKVRIERLNIIELWYGFKGLMQLNGFCTVYFFLRTYKFI